MRIATMKVASSTNLFSLFSLLDMNRTADELPSKRPLRALIRMRLSLWVMLGYLFWVGFLIGAIIMHAAAK